MSTKPDRLSRRHLILSGIVQGVGFRPFVFRLASELGLSGWVRNSPAGVEVEIQGAAELVQRFEERLMSELPPLALVSAVEQYDLPERAAESGFTILPSSGGRSDVQIAPDTALCADCLQELFDPACRRFLHPFITCTNCGPRWTIITGIPYDRSLTTMAGFPLCPDCAAEYRNPLDRRFHAQPIACPQCGPQLSLYPPHPQPLQQALDLLKQGKIVAIKGLGGFHLAVDACNDGAVACLRRRKQRDEKPFAVMVADLAAARRLGYLSEMEERLLMGPEAPVVIVRHRPDSGISPLVAPGSRWIGLMLPYTPLHHLLFQGSMPPAFVMTSANRSDEPMIADDDQAREKLAGIADAILGHNRPIHVRTDDSVVRVFGGAPIFYRRSRGYVPRPLRLTLSPPPILALGAELKSVVCLTRGDEAFLSQHIGDLKNEATLETFCQTISHLSGMLEVRGELVVCDLHPDYLSTRFAEESGLPLLKVQHHHAHMASCMVENGLSDETIGVIFDGVGLGDDGTAWGGEFLVGNCRQVRRAGHLLQVRQLGGDAAAREPWRMALAWLHGALGDAVWHLPGLPAITDDERQILKAMLERGLGSPLSSSMGRLFDAVAFLTGTAAGNSFDGQAAMSLEAAAETAGPVAPIPFLLHQPSTGPFLLDPLPTVLGIVEQRKNSADQGRLALAFHAALAGAVVDGCSRIRSNKGPDQVVLSGGVFQNRLLTELVYTALQNAGFRVFSHRLVPPNDGGIALGQAAVAAHLMAG